MARRKPPSRSDPERVRDYRYDEAKRTNNALQSDCQGHPFSSLVLLPKADRKKGVVQHKSGSG